jgi:hypothetical protein
VEIREELVHEAMKWAGKWSADDPAVPQPELAHSPVLHEWWQSYPAKVCISKPTSINALPLRFINYKAV